MRAFIGRFAAVIAGAIVTFLAGTLGLEVSEGAAAFLSEGITALGMFLWLMAYALIHRFVSRYTNPSDAART